MAFNIDRFSSHVNRSGTLPVNKFFISFQPPAGVPFSLNTAQLLYFRAEQVKLPGVIMNTIENRPYGVGVDIKFPSGVRFTDTSVTFLDDGINSIYKLFNIWTNSMVDYSGTGGIMNVSPTYRVAYKSDIVSDIYIYILDNSGYLVTTVILREAFPIFVDDTNLSWDNNNTLFKVITGFTYSGWYIENLINPTAFSPPPTATLFNMDSFTSPTPTSFTSQVSGSIDSAISSTVSNAPSVLNTVGSAIGNDATNIFNFFTK